MTPSNQKQLAEKAAEFLGLEKANNPINGNYYVMPLHMLQAGRLEDLADHFFEETTSAPILMHLALKEMEKRGIRLCMMQGFKDNRWHCQYTDTPEGVANTHDEMSIHENYFIAFWTALLEATR
ncbi:hypothetical protein LCGC14_0752420 [marine sediment metagenome]|uniref:Uncharacterized protein n=1 Tax=marine sediment metagenome TaxID=412755 RepID=A0A0F9QNF1_9ZZZZ